MFVERSRFLSLCIQGMKDLGLYNDQDYRERFKSELKEIDAQAEHEYFLNLADSKLRFAENENNLLTPYLLRICDSFDISKPPKFVQGEFPDIDVDYIKPVRDYLKREWAAKRFGKDYICEIGTYGTSGIKSAILDMTRVYGKPLAEIQAITKEMDDKDNDGKPLEWDKALEIYKDFAAYCNKNPEIADAAKLLISRNRTAGVHAGGLIISDRPISGFVPLEVRSVTKENPNGIVCSAWAEGLHTQDLQPVGLIKFDLLVIANLMQIALACDLIKKRHGLKSICALEGDYDWSDISYLNDPDSLAMANKGDLKCVFQFDSEGIRKLVKKGGVTSFDDLVAYSSLYRPGCLRMGMDARYCARKKYKESKGKEGEPYNLHPVMEKILGKTYGVMVFQEQIMSILRTVGKIPDMHTEKVRKAISKKKVKEFIKYKQMFIENGQEVLGANKEFVEELWAQVEAFSEYGFNASHAVAYTYISARLLWLKAHYPIEFYTAILMCKDDENKFREYKLDAKYHGVEVLPVDINKSDVNFSIVDDKIYFGFSNIKGINQEAERIVENQAYSDFQDFLNRFGTDAGVIKPLVALGVFDDLEPKHDRERLRKYYEYYKNQFKKHKDMQKRFEESLAARDADLKELLLTQITEDDPEFDQLNNFSEEARDLWEETFSHVMVEVETTRKGVTKSKSVSFLSLLQSLAKKRDSRIESNSDKISGIKSLCEFDFDSIVLDDEELALLRDYMVIDGVVSYPAAESEYYGFQWTHVLETSPDYTGLTIDNFLSEAEENHMSYGPVEVMVLSSERRTSKNNVVFYTVKIEDANGRRMNMNVWKDDFARWEEELSKGQLVRIQARPPSGGFMTLTLNSYPKGKTPPKEEDGRVILLRRSENLDDLTLN
jgi:DNA polymerase III alpha subunit